MANRTDKKTFYFPHDFNARNDEKITALRMKHGMLGYGVYFAIIERLGEATGHVGVVDYNVIAYDLRTDASIVKSVIHDFGLFAFTGGGECFYSESLTGRMKPLDELREKRSDAGKAGMSKRWKSEQPEQVDNTVITLLQETDNKPVTELSDFITDRGEVIEENKEKPPKGGKKKDAAIAATLLREKEFYNTLIPFVERYPKEMIRKFYNYWREKNKSGSRMKFELEKTWELPLRLATWANRDKEFDKAKKNEQKQDIHI